MPSLAQLGQSQYILLYQYIISKKRVIRKMFGAEIVWHVTQVCCHTSVTLIAAGNCYSEGPDMLCFSIFL